MRRVPLDQGEAPERDGREMVRARLRVARLPGQPLKGVPEEGSEGTAERRSVPPVVDGVLLGPALVEERQLLERSDRNQVETGLAGVGAAALGATALSGHVADWSCHSASPASPLTPAATSDDTPHAASHATIGCSPSGTPWRAVRASESQPPRQTGHPAR